MNRSLVVVFVLSGLGAVPWRAPAQTFRVYSEFQRIDPFGKVVPQDRAKDPGVRPREILSPAVARNAYASFQLAVTTTPGTQFTLYVGQNPENSFRVSMYKARFVRAAGSWIPDRLEPVTLPHTAGPPDGAQAIPGQTTTVFWMDVWVARGTKVGRIKLEPQIWSRGHWVIYPMEVRVLGVVVNSPPPGSSPLTGVGLAADATARGPLHCYLCGCDSPAPAAPPSARRLIRRNALQDVALARSAEKTHGKAAVSGMILEKLGVSDGAAWCASPVYPEDRGSEWYLRVRDALYRMASEPAPMPQAITVFPNGRMVN